MRNVVSIAGRLQEIIEQVGVIIIILGLPHTYLRARAPRLEANAHSRVIAHSRPLHG